MGLDRFHGFIFVPIYNIYFLPLSYSVFVKFSLVKNIHKY